MSALITCQNAPDWTSVCPFSLTYWTTVLLCCFIAQTFLDTLVSRGWNRVISSNNKTARASYNSSNLCRYDIQIYL